MDSGPSQQIVISGLKKLTMSRVSGVAPMYIGVRLQK